MPNILPSQINFLLLRPVNDMHVSFKNILICVFAGNSNYNRKAPKTNVHLLRELFNLYARNENNMMNFNGGDKSDSLSMTKLCVQHWFRQLKIEKVFQGAFFFFFLSFFLGTCFDSFFLFLKMISRCQ